MAGKLEETTGAAAKIPQKNPKQNEIKTVSSGTELGRLLGLTKRRIEQLTADGILTNVETERGSKSKYDTAESVKAYCSYLRNKAAGKEVSEDVEQLTLQKLQADVKYRRSKAEKAKLELREIKGQYLRASDVEDFTADLILAVRADLLAMPGKMGVILAECKDAQEITGMLEKEAASILEDVAKHKYDPAAYAERLKERQGKKQTQQDDEEDEEEF